jgi:hypothetical protein
MISEGGFPSWESPLVYTLGAHPAALATIDLFTTAPRLTTFKITGHLLGVISHPPLDQLRTFNMPEFCTDGLRQLFVPHVALPPDHRFLPVH